MFLYLLFEFQSSNNKNMALRMLEYAAVHLHDIYRRKVFKPEEKHWPILPIVLYTGASPWTAPLECSECRIPTFPSLLRFQPEMHYFLLDIPRIAKESLADEKNLSALLFRFEQCKTLEEIQDEVRKAKIRLKGEHYEEFRMALADWLWNTTTTKFKTRAPAKHKLDLEDVDSMLGETVAKIIEQKVNDARLEWKKEGEKEGRKEERKEVAIKMLKKGFTMEVISSVTDIPTSDLEKIQLQLV